MDNKKSVMQILSENRFLHIIISVVLGFVVGALFLVVMNLSVADAYGRLLSSVTTLKGISYVVVYAIPYIMTGLSVAFAFKTGVFNIGAEGQFVMGSMSACVVAYCWATCLRLCSSPCASSLPWLWVHSGASSLVCSRPSAASTKFCP